MWDPRTGKTLEYILGIGSHLELERFLVVAPKLAAITSWVDTLAEILPDVPYIDLSRGTLRDRAARLHGRRKGVAVVNPEALAAEPLKSAIEQWAPRGIVVDEIHIFRGRSTARSKSLIRLADKAIWKRGGTGTLTPTSYANVYTPYRIIDPTVFGTRKAAFQGRYCIMDKRFYNRVLGYNYTTELQAKILSIASVVRREERRTPPQDIEQKVYLPPDARKAYDRLAKKYVLELGDGASTVSHRLARMNILHQMAGGFVYGTDGKAEWFHQAKLDALLEELETIKDTGKQVLIYYLYDAEGAQIAHEITRAGLTVAFIAAMTDTQREQALRSFQAGKGAQTLVMQEQMGIGIKLSRAKTCIFYSHSERYDVHTQARDRIWEQGDDALLYVYLRAVGTSDYFYRDLLLHKESESEAMLTPGSFEKAAYGQL